MPDLNYRNAEVTTGTPFIYYGEEIGMQGRKPDEDIRLPMQWSSEANAGFTTGTPALDYQQVNVMEQNEDPDLLLNHYYSLIKLRRENPVLSNGEIVLLDTDNPGVYAVLRSSADQKILVVVNLKEAPISSYQLSLNEILLSDGTVTPRSLFGSIKAIPLTITGGKFSGYKPLNGLLPYEL